MQQVIESSPTVIRAVSHKRKGGAPASNLNAVSTLLYVRNPEERIDKRSRLGIGLQLHRRRVLQLFGCAFEDLTAVEAERVRRLIWLTTVRELACSRLQLAIAAEDADAFAEAEQRFLQVTAAEERAERLLMESVAAHKQAKPTSLQERLARSASTSTPSRQVIRAVEPSVAQHPAVLIAVDDDELQVSEPDTHLRVVAPVPAPIVEAPEITGSWACIFCGTKVYDTPKPERCQRCKTSRFKSLSSGGGDAA